MNLGIPAPLLQALTSPTRHRGRSTLPGNSASSSEGCRGRDAAPGRCGPGGRGAKLCRAPPPREITKAKAVRVRVVLGPHPSPASPPDAAGPAGYHFPRRGPPTARPGPRNPSGRGISCGLGMSWLPLSCLPLPDGWQEEVVGSRHPPCRGLRAKRENFLLSRGTQGPRESPQRPRRWQSPAAPLAAALAQSGEHIHG